MVSSCFRQESLTRLQIQTIVTTRCRRHMSYGPCQPIVRYRISYCSSKKLFGTRPTKNTLGTLSNNQQFLQRIRTTTSTVRLLETCETRVTVSQYYSTVQYSYSYTSTSNIQHGTVRSTFWTLLRLSLFRFCFLLFQLSHLKPTQRIQNANQAI